MFGAVISKLQNWEITFPFCWFCTNVVVKIFDNGVKIAWNRKNRECWETGPSGWEVKENRMI